MITICNIKLAETFYVRSTPLDNFATLVCIIEAAQMQKLAAADKLSSLTSERHVCVCHAVPCRNYGYKERLSRFVKPAQETQYTNIIRNVILNYEMLSQQKQQLLYFSLFTHITFPLRNKLQLSHLYSLMSSEFHIGS